MSFKNRWTISSSYDFQAHQQRCQRRCFSRAGVLWFEVLPDWLPVCPGLSPALPGAPRLVVSTPRLVAGAPSYSDSRQECPPRVWYSPEIHASKFTLHILSDTPGGFQWLKYILLMWFLSGAWCFQITLHELDNLLGCVGLNTGCMLEWQDVTVIWLAIAIES